MKKSKVLFGSLMTMLMSACMIAGATYSLFTSESKTDISVNSGTVDVRSSIDNNSFKLSSMDVIMPNLKFANGGSVRLEGNKLFLDNITPGDKVSFDFTIKNYSTVKTKYRAALNCVSGYKLFDKLSIDFTSDTTWTTLLPEADPKNPVGVTTTATIALSEYTGDEYQGLSTEMAIVVEAVQGNATVQDSVADHTLKADQATYTIPQEAPVDTTIATSTGSMEVNIPAEKIDPTAGKIDVSVVPTRATPVLKAAIPQDSSAVYYDIDVTGLKDTTDKVKVELYLGRGYDDVDVFHDKNGVLDEPTSVKYYSESGFVSFKTDSFSPFAITASRKAHVSDQGNARKNNEILQKAFDENKIVTLGEDIVLHPHGEFSGLNPIIEIKHDVELNMNGHKISLDQDVSELAGTSLIMGISTPSRVDIYGNGTIDSELGDNNSYGINVNNIDADLFITDGTYTGAVSAIQVSKGYCKINGGHFEQAKTIKELAPQYASYLANCIDASYGSGEAVLYIDGGEFVNQNPAVNKAESPLACATHQDYFIVSEKLNEKETLYKVIHNTDFDDILLASNKYVLQGDIWVSIGTYFSGLHTLIDINKDFTLDLNGHNIKCVTNTRLKNNGSTGIFGIDGGNVNIIGNGTIDTGCGDRTVLVANVQSTKAILNVESGKFTGAPTTFQVTQGTLNVKGGEYSLAANVTGSKDFIINCIDRYYKDGTAKINVTGGKFIDFNPADCAAEGPNTNFVSEGFEVKGSGNTYIVSPKQAQ